MNNRIERLTLAAVGSAALAGALLAPACGGGDGPQRASSPPAQNASATTVPAAANVAQNQSPNTGRAAAPATIEAFSPALVNRLTTLLNSAGVDVVADRAIFEDGSPGAAAGLAVSEFQVRNMAAEIAGGNGGGMWGQDLNEMAPMPPDAPPIAYFIAAWISLGLTPAARAAAQIMGPQDWAQANTIIFPAVVVAAFVGDAIRYSVNPPRPLGRKVAPYLDGRLQLMTAGFGGLALEQGGGGPCGVINNFVDQVFTNVFKALEIKAEGGVGGFFAAIFNKAVELVSVVIKGVVKVLTAPIAEALRVGIGVVGVASYASSMLKPWSVKVVGDPALTRWAIDNETAPEGMITASVDDPGFNGFPDALNQCARLVGMALPSTNADLGSPVKWQAAGPGMAMIERLYRDEQLPSDKVAKYKYRVTRRESKENAEHGEQIDSPLTVEVGLERSAITQLQQLLQSMFHSVIPDFAAAIANPILKPIESKVLGKLASVLRANGTTRIYIRHHTIVGCKLFTLAEINGALKQTFSEVGDMPPTGCQAGPEAGPKVQYYYSAATCQLASSAVALTGVTPLALGFASFYLISGDVHVVGFPAVSNPNSCVIIKATPLAAFTGRNLVALAGLMRGRS